MGEGDRRGKGVPAVRGSEDRCLAVAPALPGDPDVSRGVRGGDRINVRSGGIRNPHCCAGFSILNHACPDVEIRLGICGPKHPRTAFPIDRHGRAIEVSTWGADSDWFAPGSARVTFQKNLVASGWGVHKVELIGCQANAVVIRIVTEFKIGEPYVAGLVD